MKFCKQHWEELSDEINNRGLWPLVQDGKLTERITLEIRAKSAIAFDPLVSAHNMICNNALKIAGVELLQMDDNGDPKCPCCMIRDEENAACATKWINDAGEGVYTHAKEQDLLLKCGLVKK